MSAAVERALEAAAAALGPNCHLVIYHDGDGVLTVGAAEGTPDIDKVPAWVDEEDAALGDLLEALQAELWSLAEVQKKRGPQ